MTIASRVLSLLACCVLFPLVSHATQPHPGGDFPSPDSFYPPQAKLWAQEGTTIIQYCVDAAGRLSGAPTVESTSEDHDLDEAALAFAKAGDGHYLPGVEAGKAVAGCAKLKVRFVLQDDPSFPTLSRRSKQLTVRARPQFLMLNNENRAVQPPVGIIDEFVQGDPEKLQQLQDYVLSVAPVAEKRDAVLADYVAAVDELGRAADVTEAERTAFSKEWQKKRPYLKQLRQVMFDMRAILLTINEIIHYVQTSSPAVSVPREPGEQQSVELQVLIARLHRELQQAQDRQSKLAAHFAASQTAQASEPNMPEPGAEALVIVVEEIGRLNGFAIPTGKVSVPQPMTSVTDVPGCSNLRPEFDFEGGTALLQVRLTHSGTVSSVELERTSGSPAMDAMAVKCVPGMRFSPATEGGQPVASLIQFPLKFQAALETRHQTCEEFKPQTDVPAAQQPDDKPKAPAVVICSCWEESGRLVGPRIIDSIGANARLEEGALMLGAKSGMGKPRPPGHPGCLAYRTLFDLH